MIAEIGFSSLLLALILALFQVIFTFLCYLRHKTNLLPQLLRNCLLSRYNEADIQYFQDPECRRIKTTLTHQKLENTEYMAIIDRDSKQLLKLVQYVVTITFISCFSAFLCLIYSYVISDYSVLNVYQNSHHLKPLIYTISGALGNHEGSMLLLILILSSYNLAFAYLSKIEESSKIIIINIQLLISAGFLAFIIFTSNPFIKLFPVPNFGL